MKTKLKEYIDTIFVDAECRAPYNQKVRDLKEEMLQNLYDRYDDLLAAGKTPSAAYNIAVAGVGDISTLLDSVVGSGAASAPTGKTVTGNDKRTLTPEEQETVEKYKSRSAVLTSIAVAMYILCWVPLVILGTLLGDAGGIVGLTVMFLMIAGATAMLIYKEMTKPKFAEDADGDDDDDDDGDDCEKDKDGKAPRSPVYKAISGALWTLTTVVYFLISFQTGAWHITWMMFLISTAADNIIKAIFDLRR
ncbi:MAG: hypothetical protein IJA91_00800 [Clostridia bacterium]|nr:hypothetical protein [Clostridia bacterium]MBQ4323930.1 hypothetical protein [Clostridia bacterium]